MSRRARFKQGAIAVVLVAELVTAAYVLLAIWGAVTTVAAEDDRTGARVSIFGVAGEVAADTLMLVAVVVLGAIGSSIHALTSLATYVGNRQFVPSWTMWYLIRLPIGASLAVVSYFLLRAGLVSAGDAVSTLNPYGVGAIAALAGLFSKQATDKLKEAFDTIFSTGPRSGDAVRGDKVEPTFTVNEVVPPSLPVGSTDLVVRVLGTGFGEDVEARAERTPRRTRLVSETELEVELEAPDVARARLLVLRFAAPYPNTPVVRSVLRVRPRVDRVAAPDPSQPHLVRVEGLGFGAATVVEVDGQIRQVGGRGSTSLDVTLEPGDLERNLVVRNPPEDGGESDPLPLTSAILGG